MKLSSENIHQALLRSFPQGLTVKELLLFLGQKKSKKTLTRKCLKKLARKNLCKKKDNRYYSLPGNALGKKKKQIPHRGKGTLTSNGVFLIERGRSSVHDYRSNQIYPVNRHQSLLPLHGDEINFQITRGKNGKELAHIQEIVTRKTKFISGRVFKKKGHLYFAPAGKQFPDRFLVKKSPFGKFLPKNRVQLEITRYPALNVQGEGVLRFDTNGVVDEGKTILKFLWEHKVPLKFSPAILADCEKIPKRVLYSKTDSRVDLRHLQFVTIDGEDAKDFDDAIYAKQEPDGYRIWVSIADVAEYVTPDSRIDKEAFNRGTSVYLPGRVYPMLPEALSNHLCSLREGVNRNTLTCEIKLDKNCEVLNSTIYESLVKITRRLTYKELDEFFKTGDLSAKSSQSFLAKDLLLYKEISEKLLVKRERRGAINFSFPENQFVFDEEGKLIDVKKRFQTLASSLIEQFMLEANENIGKFCDFNALPILWRNHATPMRDKIRDLKSLFWQYKQKIPKLETSSDFNKALEKIQNTPCKDILEYSLLRVMSQARYETDRLGHFGLGATHYCHFTSPIRRYPDLIVHRALKNFLHDRKRKIILHSTSAHCSNREREAVKVERKTVKLKKALLMKDKVGNLYDLKVSGLHWNGIFVEIAKPYVEGFLPFNAIGDDRYTYNEENQCVDGKNTGRKIIYGSSLKGILQRIDWTNFCPEFNWISWTESV